MQKAILLLVMLLAVNVLTFCQQTFVKTFPGLNYNPFQDFTAINDNEYACVTQDSFYLINAQGQFVNKQQFKEGGYSVLSSIQKDDNGNLWILAHVLTIGQPQQKVIYKLNSTGQLLNRTAFTGTADDSYEALNLVKSAANKFFIVHKDFINGEAHIEVSYINEQMNILWSKELTGILSGNNYSFSASANGALTLAYGIKAGNKKQLVTVTPAGDVSYHDMVIQTAANTQDYISGFTPAHNNGYLLSGSVVYGNKYDDGVIIKTDANGTEQWRKVFDISRGDAVHDIKAVNGGYLLLCTSSLENWGNDIAGDILLIKTDENGNEVWRKAFGSAKRDYAKKMLVLNNHVLIGAQATYTVSGITNAVVIKTDLNGNINSSIPFQLSPSTDIIKITSPAANSITRSGKAVAGFDNSVLIASHMLDKANDNFKPSIVKTDLNGNVIFNKPLSDISATARQLKRTADGNYIAIIQYEQSSFGNYFDVIKLNASGDSIWKATLPLSGYFYDIISTNDGGCLLTGTRDISVVNYEVFVVKLNAQGKIVWSKNIGETGKWETARSIIETPENDYLLVGNSQTEFDITSYIHILKIDKNGNKLWAKTFAGAVTTDVAYDVVLSADNNYVLAGVEAAYPENNRNIVVMKLDKQGNLIWKKIYDIASDDVAVSIINTADEGFVITGTTGEKLVSRLEKYAFIIKLNKQGNKEWEKYYGADGLQTSASSIIKINDNKIALIGTIQEHYGNEKIFMVQSGIQAANPVPQPDNTIQVYPVPADIKTLLQINNNYTGFVGVNIFDAAGKLVKSSVYNKNLQLWQQEIWVYNLASGIYTVKINIGTSLFIKKLIIQHN